MSPCRILELLDAKPGVEQLLDGAVGGFELLGRVTAEPQVGDGEPDRSQLVCAAFGQSQFFRRVAAGTQLVDGIADAPELLRIVVGGFQLCRREANHPKLRRDEAPRLEIMNGESAGILELVGLRARGQRTKGRRAKRQGSAGESGGAR